jgi:UDP-N-acetylmuramate: L-alanyl-gamma-D-glutamyl-meso-diaminopimelate ligase
MSHRLANAGVQVTLGFDAKNITDDPPDVVLVGNITRRDNPEAVAMRRLNLPHLSLPELLGQIYLTQRRSVTVAGTHGKTTTSSMVSWLLKSAGLAPGYMIGGVPIGLESGLDSGSGEHFVLEADEYDTAYFDKRAKFVHYRPKIGILTSVEFDHADIYVDFDAIRLAFRTYARLFPEGARLWVHGNDVEAMNAAQAGHAQVCTYGLAKDLPNGDIVASDVALARGSEPTRFRAHYFGQDLGIFELKFPGRHNVWNALAALAVCLSEGVDVDDLRRGLASFEGVRRRQELRGEPQGIRVIQDYAHHPTAVRETLSAIRAQFPDRRIWGLFEAESNTSRRKTFQEAYVHAFGDADQVVFVRPLEKDDKLPPEERLSADQLVADLDAIGVVARFIPEPDELLETLLAEVKSQDVVLFMSGRNFLGLPLRLVDALT